MPGRRGGRFHVLVQHRPSWAQAATARAVVQALLGGDVLALQRLTHPDVVHRGARPGQPAGWAGLRELALTSCANIPDATVELVCSEGDTAVCRVHASVGRPGWGTAVARHALVVLRFRDGRVGELWSSSDLTATAPVVAA